MRFEDERYVRLYTRDTTTWLMLPWQSRAILPQILRKVDRAGILDLGADGLEALSAHIQFPLEVVEAGMPELLRRGVLVMRDDVLLWPKFIEGQEAKQSDRARAKASRERARDMAKAAELGVTIRDGSVTPRDDSGTPRDGTVTRGHAASQPVTLSCASPSRTVPSRSSGSDGGSPEQPGPRDPDAASHLAQDSLVVPAAMPMGTDGDEPLRGDSVPQRPDPACGTERGPFELGTAGLVEAEATYQTTVSDALARPVAITFRMQEREALVSILDTHFRSAPTKLAAIAGMAQALAAWVREVETEGGGRYTLGWSPKKFLEWLNVTGSRSIAKGPPSAASSPPDRGVTIPPEATMAPEEFERRIQEFRETGGAFDLLKKALGDGPEDPPENEKGVG